eukprot:jgi/Tetstr1/449605/TSEL_036692.t1
MASSAAVLPIESLTRAIAEAPPSRKGTVSQARIMARYLAAMELVGPAAARLAATMCAQSLQDLVFSPLGFRPSKGDTAETMFMRFCLHAQVPLNNVPLGEAVVASCFLRQGHQNTFLLPDNVLGLKTQRLALKYPESLPRDCVSADNWPSFKLRLGFPEFGAALRAQVEVTLRPEATPAARPAATPAAVASAIHGICALNNAYLGHIVTAARAAGVKDIVQVALSAIAVNEEHMRKQPALQAAAAESPAGASPGAGKRPREDGDSVDAVHAVDAQPQQSRRRPGGA